MNPVSLPSEPPQRPLQFASVFQFGNSAVRQFGSFLALISLLGLTACPAPQNPPKTNKQLEESQTRLWRRPDASQPGTETSPKKKEDPSASVNLENGPLPLEISEKLGAKVEIACGGGEHPPVADLAERENVQLTPEGEKALLLTIHPSCACSATNNCPREIWSVDEHGTYLQRLSEDAYDLLFANTVHNGHYDVVTEAHLTDRESSIIRYEWDGKLYRPVEQSCRVGEPNSSDRKVVPGKCR